MGDLFGIGGAVGGAFDLASAELMAEAQRDAAKINAENQRAINAENLALAREARGANGLPVSLPLYTGSAEQGLFNNADAAYKQIMKQWGDPAQQYEKNRQRRDIFRPAMEGANQFASDLFTGGQTAARLKEQQPVSQARLNVAGAQKQGLNSQIQQKLNEIKATQANRGYVGSSTFENAALIRNTAPMYQDLATADAMARYQNALDVQNIYSTDRQQALANLSIPAQMTQQNIQWEQMPALSMVEGLNNAYNVYAPFRLNEWKPPTMQSLPTVNAEATTAGAVGAGLQSVGNSFDQYLRDQAQQKASQSYLDALTKIATSNNNAAAANNNWTPKEPYQWDWSNRIYNDGIGTSDIYNYV